MKNIMKLILSAVLAASSSTLLAAEQPWQPGVLTVAQGNVVNLTQDYATNYNATAKEPAVTLHGDLTVTAPHYFIYCWSGEGAVAAKSVYMDFSAVGAGSDTARLTLDGCALDSYYSNSRRLDIREYAEARKPDEAAITLRNGSTLTMGSIWVVATASSTGDHLTELDIGTNCRVDLATINSRSSKPLKVKFSGSGAMMRGWTFSGSASSFNMVQASCGGFIVEGTPDSPVDIRSWTSGTADSQKLLNNAGNSASKLVFQGDCDVRLVSSAANTPMEVNLPNIEFRQTGDLRFEGTSGGGCSSIVSVEDVLPAGAGVGNVRVVSVKNKTAHTLRLCGGSQKLNGLILENGSQVACDDAVTLTFGVDDTDGVLDGLSSDGISVVKVGAGTLTVTNATVASMVVSNGLVVVDGGVLTCGRLVTEGSGRVSYRNGGRIVTTSGSATWEVPPADDSRHAIAASSAPQVDGLGLYYAGTTAMTYLDGGTVGDVNVRSGTLRVGGTLVSDPYWRVTFTGAAGGNASAKWDDEATYTSRYVSLALGRLHPLSVDGAAVNVATAAEGHFATETPTATATAGSWSFNPAVTYLGWSLARGTTGVGFMPETMLSEENPVVVTVKTTAPIWGYGMSRVGTCSVGAPAAWKVESSADGQTGWTLRDERADQADRSVNMGWEDYGNDGVPYPLSAGTACSFCSTGLVAVAAGATLDLSEVAAERISIKGLRIDMQSGAGTITRFVPAENGKLYLSSVPEDWYVDGSIARMHDLPLTVNGISGERNLSGWELYVDGERVGDGRVEWRKGKLRAGVPSGLKVLFR